MIRCVLWFFVFLTSAFAELVHEIHSRLPAGRWEDTMLSGNGMTGVMQYGTAPRDSFIFTNHKLLLPNNARDPIPDMADAMVEMRAKMLAGDIGGGWADYWKEWNERAGTGNVWTQQFHPGYRLDIDLLGGSYPTEYKRITDYRTGVITVRYTDGYGEWTRETFASRAQDVVVTRLRKSSEGRQLMVRFDLHAAENHPQNVTKEPHYEKGYVRWRSKYAARKGQRGGYEGLTRVIAKGKDVHQSIRRGRLVAQRADEVLLITGLERYRTDFSEWDKGALKARLDVVTADFDVLLAEHVAIHQPIYDRVTYDLGASEADRALSTEQLIAKENADTAGITPAYLERLFATSRYLFMASSGEHYAPRLSGLFIGKWGAAWAGDYTMDANANMAVLGGYIGDMPEMMRGYQAIIERSLPQWREGAKKLYGMRGILGPVRIDGEVGVPHHMNHYHAHLTATGLGPWILYPLWEHYLVTGDKAFLRDTLYPLLVEQLHFYEDFLTHRDEHGKVIFVPSNSPENASSDVKPRTSASINSTMDISACRQLLTNLLQAERDLGLPASATAQKLLADLPPYLVNDEGALKEWAWPTLRDHYGHRHSSYVYAVWPGYDINPENPATAHFVPAMAKALSKRNHRIVQAHDFIQRAIGWLRVKNGEEFYKILKYTLENNYHFLSLATSHDLNHRIYNFDYILTLQGLLIENALFTQPGILEVLPAMPEALATGRFTGLKGRNRCTIHELRWDLERKTVALDFTSDIDQTLTLINRCGISTFAGANTKPSPHGDHARQLTLKAGERTALEIRW